MIGVPPRSSSEPLQLHIGCGTHRLADYVNCDVSPTSAADRIFDCTGPWPFPDDSASVIYCSHTLEHLHDFRSFFREAHRVLRPDGALQIRVPYGDHKAAWWDISHVRPWYPETFCFLQPGYAKTIGNAQHDDWTHYFSVEDSVLRLSARLVPILRWRLLRRVILPWIDLLNNAVEELWVYLIPLKTPEAVRDWSGLHPGNAIGVRYSMYRHHLERRPAGPHEVVEFVDWRRDMAWNGFHAWLGK